MCELCWCHTSVYIQVMSFSCCMSCCSVGSCWWNPSLSERQASALGNITDVRLGGANGSTEVIAAQSRRIGQRYYIHQSTCGLQSFPGASLGIIAVVKITSGHRSISVHFIRMTGRFARCPVNLTRQNLVHAH